MDNQLLNQFKGTINASGLKWAFTKPDKKVVFIDLNISIEKDAFSTNLYKKPLALLSVWGEQNYFFLFSFFMLDLACY